MSDINYALQKFKIYKERYEELKSIDLSETDTRSKIVDEIFKDILGWDENDIVREEFGDSGSYDYKISLPGFHLIVEAKKQFIDFVLPNSNRKTSFNVLLKQNEKVIKQIRGYAMDQGVSYGVITNGRQFIIGKLLNTDGTDWKKNTCLIFHSLEDVESRFIDFYNNLSRDSIIENGGVKFLSIPENIKFQKIVSKLIDRDKEIIRNNLSSDLLPILNMFFGEMYDENKEDIDFIKNCFVSTTESKKNRSEIEKMFPDLAPNLTEVIPAKNTSNISAQMESQITDTPIHKDETRVPKPIIIIGSKGAGKSTFIKFVFNSNFSSKFHKDHIHIYIDFRQYSELNPDTLDENKLSQNILKLLYDKYSELKLHSRTVLKRIYYKEIKHNNESIWEGLKEKNEDKYEDKLSDFLEEKIHPKEALSHLSLLSQYLIRERRRRLVLVVDNVDQFNNETQQQVFLFANSLNSQAKCGLFVSLREGYYYKWKNSPPFDAFENNVYHVSTPNYSEVLQKRIDYTLFKLQIGESPLMQSIKDTEGVVEFLSSVQSSFFGPENREMVNFLQHTTFPNIRDGLAVFKLFITSGYTDVQEYIKREVFTEVNKIPIHAFIKTIGLGNKLYYNHETSVIKNVFYPSEDSNDHFIKIWILKYLTRKIHDGDAGSRYESIEVIIETFVDYGYNFNRINNEISMLLRDELIETEEVLSDVVWNAEPMENLNLCVNSKGHYYIQYLKNHFHYFDLIIQDTPIFNEASFDILYKSFPKPTEEGKKFLLDRLNSVQKFMDYLEIQERMQSTKLISTYGSVVEEIWNDGLRDDFERINKLLENT